MKADLDFSGQVALVTGGASGIGYATLRQLSALGAQVVVADANGQKAAEAAASLSGPGSDAFAITVDVSKPAQVRAMVEEVVARYGKIDILVHSAGIGVEKPFLTTSVKEWRRLLDVNLSGTFYCAQAVARRMVANRYGRIVHLSSVAGLRGGTGRAAYGATKGGIATLTKVMAVELATYGITVNALAPGAIETDLVARMHTQETRLAYRSRIPVDRYGTPDETAAAAVFLCSRQASYVNGHILAVDGGFMAAGVMKSQA